MRCFKHPKSEAVGICSSCNKGVCSKCAVEKDGKIYCKDCLSKSKFAEIKCANHPRSEAVGMCTSCGKPICEDCAIDKEGKLYCRLCSAALPPEFEPQRQTAVVEVPQRKYEEQRIPLARMEGRRIPSAKIELAVKPSETVSSTIVGGIAGGFMMGLPFINFLFFWSALGGVLSVYLLRLRVDRYGNGYIRRQDALVVGAISGVFSALIATAFNIIYAVLLHGLVMQATEFLLSVGLGVEISDLIIKLAVTDLSLSSLFIFIKLVATIILFALLGAVGGAISSELSKR
jgi:hypothetical protein